MALNLFTWHSLVYSLALVGSLCFLLSAALLAGIRPMTFFSHVWQAWREKISGLSFAWPVVNARTKGLAINCAVALIFFVLGWLGHGRELKAQEHRLWEQNIAKWQREFEVWNARQPHKGEPIHEQSISYAERSTTATSATATASR